MILPRWIGHRGVAGLAPENTLASIRLAASLGVAMVEFDTRLSADGVPVVFHDDRLERTTNAAGPVREKTAAQLAALDAGSWFSPDYAGEPVPSLEQVLGLCLDLGLACNLEIKPDHGHERETARAALEVALGIWPADRPAPLISSFALPCLEEAQALAPGWPRGWLLDSLPGGWEAVARRLAVTSINLAQDAIDTPTVTAIKDKGIGILAYTVNDPARAAVLWAMGVDSIFSDHPTSS